MIRVLPALVELGLLVFCLIECIQAPEGEIRNLPRWAWIVLILLVPARRRHRLAGGRATAAAVRTAPVGPVAVDVRPPASRSTSGHRAARTTTPSSWPA